MAKEDKKYAYKQITKDVDEYKYEVTVQEELYKTTLEHVYRELAPEVKIAGFRPGKAPRKSIEAKLGTKLITETFGHLMPQIAYEVVVAENLNPISQLSYELTSIDPKEGIKFAFKFANYPTVKVGDLNKIKIEEEKVEVKDDEVELLIRNMIVGNLPKEKWAKEEKVEKNKPKEAKKEKREETPKFELTDELIKELKFEEAKTVDEMKQKVKDKLLAMKTQQASEKKISDTLKKAIELSDVPAPKYFVQKEVERLESIFTERLKEINLGVEAYLQTQGTTLEKKREEWNKDAKDKVQIELLLLQIALDAKAVPSNEEIKAEIDKIEDTSVREQYETEEGKNYLRSILTKQKAIKVMMDKVEGKKK